MDLAGHCWSQWLFIGIYFGFTLLPICPLASKAVVFPLTWWLLYTKPCTNLRLGELESGSNVVQVRLAVMERMWRGWEELRFVFPWSRTLQWFLS